MQPQLSICIPTYNRAGLIKRAIESVHTLYLRGIDIEVIISDDASQDNTSEVIAELSKQYSYIRYFRNSQNYGALGNVRLAMRRARGAYIYNMADDDTMIGDAVADLVSVLHQFPDVALVTAHYRFLTDGIDEVEPYTPQSAIGNLQIIKKGDFSRLFTLVVDNGFFPEVFIIRNDVVNSIGIGWYETSYPTYVILGFGLERGDVLVVKEHIQYLHCTSDHQNNMSYGNRVWNRSMEGFARVGMDMLVRLIDKAEHLTEEQRAEYNRRSQNYIRYILRTCANFCSNTGESTRGVNYFQRNNLWNPQDEYTEGGKIFSREVYPRACADEIILFMKEGLRVQYFCVQNDEPEDESIESYLFFQTLRYLMSSGCIVMQTSHIIRHNLQDQCIVIVRRPDLVPPVLEAGFNLQHIFIPCEMVR